MKKPILLEEMLAFVRFGKNLGQELRNEQLEPGSAIYEALKLVAAGRAVITDEGLIKQNPEQSTAEREAASRKIRRYREAIKDEITKQYLTEQEHFIETARRSGIGIIYFKDFRVRSDYYFPKSCLYVAVGHPELAKELLVELGSMDKRLRDAQIVIMAQEGLSSGDVSDLLQGRCAVNSQIVEVNAALGDDEAANRYILRVDQLGVLQEYASETAFRARVGSQAAVNLLSDELARHARRRDKWIDGSNQKFYTAAIANRNKFSKPSKFYASGLEGWLSESKTKAQQYIGSHKRALQSLKTQSAASQLAGGTVY